MSGSARCTRFTWWCRMRGIRSAVSLPGQDLATFFDCHRRAFEHFGGVPATVVDDRTKTVMKRHFAPGKAVPLHPEAVAFAGSYGFDIDVLAAYRPTRRGRFEWQVDIVRDRVAAGRVFDSISELDTALIAWVLIRRHQVSGLLRRQPLLGPGAPGPARPAGRGPGRPG
jgi:transposase